MASHSGSTAASFLRGAPVISGAKKRNAKGEYEVELKANVTLGQDEETRGTRPGTNVAPPISEDDAFLWWTVGIALFILFGLGLSFAIVSLTVHPYYLVFSYWFPFYGFASKQYNALAALGFSVTFATFVYLICTFVPPLRKSIQSKVNRRGVNYVGMAISYWILLSITVTVIQSVGATDISYIVAGVIVPIIVIVTVNYQFQVVNEPVFMALKAHEYALEGREGKESDTEERLKKVGTHWVLWFLALFCWLSIFGFIWAYFGCTTAQNTTSAMRWWIYLTSAIVYTVGLLLAQLFLMARYVRSFNGFTRALRTARGWILIDGACLWVPTAYVLIIFLVAAVLDY
jgi:hypothetical protein